MFERWVEDGLLDLLSDEGVDCIPFSPLAQGLLTNKYLHGIPDDSRVAKSVGFFTEANLTPERLEQVCRLNDLAQTRNQSLAQMALVWLLKDEQVTSVLIGASRPEQLDDSLRYLENLAFSTEEPAAIEGIL